MLTIKTADRRHISDIVRMSLLRTLNIFTLFRSISIVVLEHVNVHWKTSPIGTHNHQLKIRM